MSADIAVIDEDQPQASAAVIVEKDEQPIVADKFKGRVSFEDEKMVVTLKFPFKTIFRKGTVERTEQIDRLRFRRANGGDLRALQNFRNEEEKTLQLFYRLSGLVEAQFDQVEYIDIEFCMAAIESFLLGGPTTGKN